MKFLKQIFGKGDKQPNVAFQRDFLSDLAGETPINGNLDEQIDALTDAGLLCVVDWADEAEEVIFNIGPLREGKHTPSSEKIENILAAGNAAGSQGRGYAALPTIVAFDEALIGSGERLLWIDRGGDCYEIARVSDATWEKWYDVSVGPFNVFAATKANELPKSRNLSPMPRL